MFSKACQYALRAVIYIATRSEKGEIASLNDIADAIDSPNPFTAKILQKLVKVKIISSTRGAYGGFQTDMLSNKRIPISSIVKAIDGDTIYMKCGLGFKNCSDKTPCPVHDKFKGVRDGLRMMLETTTIHELAIQLETGQGILNEKL